MIAARLSAAGRQSGTARVPDSFDQRKGPRDGPPVVDFTGLGTPPLPPLLPVTEFADEGVMDRPPVMDLTG
jgi:hypothetical protein